MKQANKTPTDGFWSRIRARYGEESIPARDTVVLCGERRVIVYSCQKILFYSPCEIRLLVAKRALSVLGERLYCSSFSGGTVTVEGRIDTVRYVPSER